MKRLNILLATEVIHPGGAETFVLRLSNALRQKGHKVHIFIFYEEQFNEKLYKLFAPDVPLTIAAIPFPWLLGKIDAGLFRMNIDVSLRNFFIKRSLAKIIRREKVKVIHSNLLKSDKLCLEVARQFGKPVITTIHGDYLQFYNKTQNKLPIPLLQYKTKALKNIKELDEIVCISDKQLAFFHEKFEPIVHNKLAKIYNGYDGSPSTDAGSLKKLLNIPEGDFVFGMVSRGIPEKGWEVAIQAFLKLNKPNTHLVLVGESDHLRALSNSYSQYANIHFTGHSDKPLDWIQIMDAGLLPTTYPSESLPTVIIEYLCCGVPCIASDAGEIVNMIEKDGNVAGLVVPIVNNAVSVDGIATAMNSYLTDSVLYKQHKNNAKLCYEQFDMDKCIKAYYDIYYDVILDKIELQTANT
ncbi:hypothetical protein CAP35_00980 [Chitinophagaceae bacterium IBVUCB1]|nr:hypothetical protein CAP35_00980 [Chitinophagaceae bacterium IBVUCB1]